MTQPTRVMNQLRTYFTSTSTWLVFILINLAYLLSGVILNEFILIDNLYYNSLSEQLTYERIGELLVNRQKWLWVQYALIPISITIKVFLITLCLNIGFLLFPHEMSFTKIFKIALKAELVFALAAVVNVVVFYLVIDASSLEELSQMNWFSLLNLIDTSTLEPWLLYPIGLINIYEVLYCLLLTLGVALVLNISPKQTFGVIAGSYGSALLLWALIIVFIQVNSL